MIQFEDYSRAEKTDIVWKLLRRKAGPRAPSLQEVEELVENYPNASIRELLNGWNFVRFLSQERVSLGKDLWRTQLDRQYPEANGHGLQKYLLQEGVLRNKKKN